MHYLTSVILNLKKSYLFTFDLECTLFLAESKNIDDGIIFPLVFYLPFETKSLIRSFIFIFFFVKISHFLYCPNCETKLTLIFVDPISPLGKSSTILLIVIRVNIYCIHSRLSTFRLITQRYDTTIPCVVIL